MAWACIITGPAPTVSATQAASSTATGSTSSARRAGTLACVCVQKWRMPLRLSATRVRKPEASNRPRNSQPLDVGRCSSKPDSIANLPTKPDSGGSPAMSSVQPTKLRPRKATPAGMARPYSACASSSRLTSSKDCRSSDRKGALPADSCGAMLCPALRQRSIMSMSRNRALAASVELSR